MAPTNTVDIGGSGGNSREQPQRDVPASSLVMAA
jgi:hypothetical protein